MPPAALRAAGGFPSQLRVVRAAATASGHRVGKLGHRTKELWPHVGAAHEAVKVAIS